jgi:hypothetical protein
MREWVIPAVGVTERNEWVIPAVGVTERNGRTGAPARRAPVQLER